MKQATNEDRQERKQIKRESGMTGKQLRRFMKKYRRSVNALETIEDTIL